MHKICFTVSLFHASTCFVHHALIVRSSKIVLYSLWYHNTETSEWSKITKITKITKIYKYEHIVVKFMCEFFGCDYCIYYKHVVTCRGYVYPVIKHVRKVQCLFTFMFAESIQS